MSMVQRRDQAGACRDRMFSLADVPALEAALKYASDCKLVVIDPIGSFLGARANAHRDNEVRGILAPVAHLARKYGPAVLVVAHARKQLGGSADEKALGSQAFTGIARAVWHVWRDPNDKARRLMLAGKNNLAPEGSGLAFSIRGERNSAGIEWEPEAVNLSADEGLAQESNQRRATQLGPEPQARDAATRWLANLLADGRTETARVRREAEGAGLAWRTVQRAADVLEVIREKNCAVAAGGWQWRLPAPDAQTAASTCQVPQEKKHLASWHLAEKQGEDGSARQDSQGGAKGSETPLDCQSQWEESLEAMDGWVQVGAE